MQLQPIKLNIQSSLKISYCDIMFLISGFVNIALNKPATQSSTWTVSSEFYTADKAVDGDVNTFTYTAEDQHPSWWKVDLQDKYSIEKIVLLVPALTGSK